MKFIAMVFSIFLLSDFCAFSPTQNGSLCIAGTSLDVNSVLCVASLIQPRWPSKIELSSDRLLMNFS